MSHRQKDMEILTEASVISENSLQLIIIDDSSNDAEVISNLLRNAGLAVRARHVEDDADLRAILAMQDWDMALAKLTLPYFNAIDAIGVVRGLNVDLPIILIDDGAPEDSIEEALVLGARDMVSLTNPQWLKHVVLRERADRHTRQHLRQCQQKLDEASHRAQGLVNNSRDAITYTHDGMHIYANDSYLQMFGYTVPGEIEGMPVMNMVVPEEQAQLKEFLRNLARGQEHATKLALRGLRADGTNFPTEMEFSLTAYEGESCQQIVIRDQSANKVLEERLDDLSKKDLLTGAYNRPYFLEQLHEKVRQGRGTLLYIKPDNFRTIREEVGIARSDLVVADVAGLLQRQLQPGDLLCRFDNPVFTVLLPDADLAVAVSRSRTLLKAVEDHLLDIAGQQLNITLSIGIVEYSSALADVQEILSRAEKARKQVSTAGGNGYHSYNPAAEELAEQESTARWAKQIKLALRDGTLRLVYQPIVSLRGSAGENYQVLLRTLDEDGELVLPAEFLPAAERAGLMVAVDRWVLGNAIKVLAERRKNGSPAHFFIKLSRASLRDANLLPWLVELIRATHLEADSLVLEISEHLAETNIKAVKSLIEGLRQLRIRIALDHFGTGSNSYTLLKHLDTDYLKIDGALISGLARDNERQAKVKELTALAKAAERLTVAEFVEDANTLAILWSNGVDFIQGHFLAEPGMELDYNFSSHVT